MTAVATQPRTVSPSIGLLEKVQSLESPLIEQVRTIRRDERRSESAKLDDIRVLVENNDQAMSALVETAKSEASALLSSAQESLRFERGKLDERIIGITGSELSFEQDAKRALIEPKRTRVATEGEQLVRAMTGDDDFARWAQDVIAEARNGEQDARLQLDWIQRVGLKLAKNQSTEPTKYTITSRLINEAHAEIFDVSKIRAAEQRIRDAMELLDGARGFEQNFLRKVKANRDLKIKGVR